MASPDPGSVLLFVAAALGTGVALAHSILGERYILIRLFRRSDLPTLFGGTDFTRRTLRFAWHLTSIAWLGFAALLWLMAGGGLDLPAAGWVVAVTFLASALLTAWHSRGRHLAWPVFLVIGLAGLVAAL